MYTCNSGTLLPLFGETPLALFIFEHPEEDTELNVKDEGFWEEGNALPGCISWPMRWWRMRMMIYDIQSHSMYTCIWHVCKYNKINHSISTTVHTIIRMYTFFTSQSEMHFSTHMLSVYVYIYIE